MMAKPAPSAAFGSSGLLEPRVDCSTQVGIIEPIDIFSWMAMDALHVRNLDPELIGRLKRRAARHGRSAEAEHREILRHALMSEPDVSFDDLAAEMRKLTAGRVQTPSEALMREGRDER